jgi:fibronectin-binding autotransporter adhesin
MGGKAVGILFTSKENLLAGACTVALAIGCLLPSPASAANYLVSNDTQLRNAITAANADGDANAVIRMTAAFTVGVTALPTPTKPMTVDTQGFTGAPLNFLGVGGQVTLIGAFQGASGTPGQRGLALGNGASVINNASITGGDGGGSSLQGLGVYVQTAGTLVNNGVIKGGGSGGGIAGGLGVQVDRASSVVNNGLIQGGDGQGVTGGTGVFFGVGPTGALSTLVNNGTIRGGAGLSGANGGLGMLTQNVAGLIVNTGTIAGSN